jgi:catechol 1,2-dioxygenase
LTTPGVLTHNYRPDAPATTILAPPGFPGQRLTISGTVYASDCVTPLSNVLIEVWQTDANGEYDLTPPYSLRAKLRTDEQGRYRFTTIKPGYIHTSDFIISPFIHYRLSHQDELILSTNLFFAGDYVFDGYWSAFSDLVVPLTKVPRSDGVTLQGTFNLAIPIKPD